MSQKTYISYQFAKSSNTINTLWSIHCLPLWLCGWLGAAARCPRPESQGSIVLHLASPGKDQNSKYGFYWIGIAFTPSLRNHLCLEHCLLFFPIVWPLTHHSAKTSLPRKPWSPTQGHIPLLSAHLASVFPFCRPYSDFKYIISCVIIWLMPAFARRLSALRAEALRVRVSAVLLVAVPAPTRGWCSKHWVFWLYYLFIFQQYFYITFSFVCF